MGSVVASGDCIGVRKNINANEIDWTVDNSNHNPGDTVWHRKFKETDGIQLTETAIPATDQNWEHIEITFDGYHSNLLHFTLEERSGSNVDKREFKFDYPPKGGSDEYGIKGHQFEVKKVTNSSMIYSWVE